MLAPPPQLVAVLATIFNGSYMVPFKLQRVQRATSAGPPSLMVYQVYVMLGVLSSGIAAELALQGDFVVDPQGFLAAAIFLIAMVANFCALTDKPGNLGLALTQAICSAVNVLTAVFVGVVVLGDRIESRLQLLAGMVVQVCGVMGVAFCKPIAAQFKRCCGEWCVGRPATPDPTAGAHAACGIDVAETEKLASVTSDSFEAARAARRVSWICFLLCVVSGVTGGCMLLPMEFAGEEHRGVRFAFSFSVGMVGCSSVCLGVHLSVLYFRGRITTLRSLLAELVPREVLLPGVASGLCGNCGNVLAAYAITHLGYAGAYPIYFCADLVSGFWAIVIWRDVRGLAVLVFTIASLITAVGATILNLAVEIGPLPAPATL